MIKPIEKKSIYKEVFDYIIKMISTGEIGLGDKLPNEIELSDSFKVSRNSVREALKSLEILDIITSKTGTGTIVSPNALRNIKYLNLFTSLDDETATYNLLEARLIIEPELTYRAIKKATQEDIDDLENIIESSIKDLKMEIYRWDLGQAFHDKISQISGNNYLQNFISATSDEIATVRKKYISFLDSNQLLAELDEHLQILECFKTKDAERGSKAMKKHLEDAIALMYDFIFD